MEQPACLHSNMDLLKWAWKLGPLLNSDLLCDVLEVALEARRVDVAASPYDASAFLAESIRIETEEGRRIYKKVRAREERSVRLRCCCAIHVQHPQSRFAPPPLHRNK